MMSKQLILLGAFLVTISCGAANDDGAGEKVEDRIARIERTLEPTFRIKGQDVETFEINERLNELGAPGLSVAFAVGGKIEWARAYGMADADDDRPMSTETMLLAGSISKPVAAIRAHQLVENGTFDLDEDINAYLSSWQVPENEFTISEKVTIRRILNHTAGLSVWGFPGYDIGDEIPSVIEVLDGMGNTDPVRVYKEPGESWMYSGGGYTVLQLAITDEEGVSFPQTMRENVLDPLDMPNSTFENPLPSEFHAIAATGYRENGTEVEGKWPIYPEMAAAGLWTTPGELIQYATNTQEILQSGNDGVLKSETVASMLTPGMNDHGLGPVVTEHHFGHGGADEGFRARLVAWKAKPYAVVIMVNSDNGGIIDELMLAIATEYDLPGIEPTVREVNELPIDQLENYRGNYVFEVDDTTCDIELRGSQLVMTAEWLESPMTLLPESETIFFDALNGNLVEFHIDDGVVGGLTFDGYRSNRTH
jgi:CubicO group peptidase (beta-lactamase class C family)